MELYRLGDSEFRFATIIWKNEPLNSSKLVKLCEEELGWKKSTTYTVLKKLCDKRIFQNKDTIVTSLIQLEQIERYESAQFLDRTFDGSLPRFITAFLNNKKITSQEAEELKKLIDDYKEG